MRSTVLNHSGLVPGQTERQPSLPVYAGFALMSTVAGSAQGKQGNCPPKLSLGQGKKAFSIAIVIVMDGELTGVDKVSSVELTYPVTPQPVAWLSVPAIRAAGARLDRRGLSHRLRLGSRNRKWMTIFANDDGVGAQHEVQHVAL